MPKVISVPFTKEGLDKLAKFLNDYADNYLPKKVNNLISVMCKRGESWAINMVGHIDTGETLSSIHGYRRGNKGVIVAGGNAIWIEFGTGVVANRGNAPHPKMAELGMSPWGTYGKGHGASLNGWYYPDENGTHEFDGQKYSHTMGIPSNRFMYNTAQMLKVAFPELAKEVFK